MFSVNKITLSDFIAHKIFLYDGDSLTEMDITFSASKGRPKAAKFQPKTALVRFEFMELLFRLALKRYFESILLNLTLNSERSKFRSSSNRKAIQSKHNP